MKNKFLLVGVIFALVLWFSTGVYADNQEDNGGLGVGNQIKQQTQVSNEGEDNQIQVENNEQLQGESENESESGIGDETDAEDGMQTQAQVQTQTGQKAQNQNNANANQNQNQGEGNDQNQPGSATAEQVRSEVANAVQEMLKLTENNTGIGQQVKTIAQAQNQNQTQLETSLQKIQGRSGFARFFIGANYGEINNAKGILEQNTLQIQELNQLKNQLANQGDQQKLSEQIQVLEQANLQVENYLNQEQGGFSLFGWLFKRLAQ